MLDKKHTISIIAIICIVLFGFLYFFIKPKEEVILTSTITNEPQAVNTTTNTTENNAKDISKNIIAYISGEVNNPDVYELENDSRVKDLVLKAGGFTTDADQNNINLSQKLKDEQHVHIYKIGENIVIESSNDVNNQNSLININTATKEELMTLPSIGDSVSDGIIAYREKEGKFNTIEDIKNVDRIGDKTFEKIKDLITAP